jgi:hypothetical protein
LTPRLCFHITAEQAAIKCLYLVTRSLDPTGTGRTRWTMRWKPALNAFAITFADREHAQIDRLCADFGRLLHRTGTTPNGCYLKSVWKKPWS